MYLVPRSAASDDNRGGTTHTYHTFPDGWGAEHCVNWKRMQERHVRPFKPGTMRGKQDGPCDARVIDGERFIGERRHHAPRI